VTPPVIAVCKGTPGAPLTLPFNSLLVQPNLDLIGEIDCGAGIPLSWGELTHPGQRQTWDIEALQDSFTCRQSAAQLQPGFRQQFLGLLPDLGPRHSADQPGVPGHVRRVRARPAQPGHLFA